MNTNQGTLVINCKIMNFSIFYEMETVIWNDENSEISIEVIDDEQVGYLRIWKEKVKLELIKETSLLLQEKIDNFLLGMQFIGNRKLSFNKTKLFYYVNDDEEYLITNDLDIEAIIRRSKGEEFTYINIVLPSLECKIEASSSPVSLPKKMPLISIKLRRYILTIIQAEELDKYTDYQDEKLKRWFLILEELTKDKSDKKFQDIKCVRNFVSHSVCNSKEVIAFLKRELPIAIYKNSSGCEEAQFHRDNNDHIFLVVNYENYARSLARELVKEKIIEDGGYV